MTTEEIRRAAERMHRMACAKLGIPMADAAKAWVEDNWAVSTAWLAEHPADEGELMTAEWLGSLPAAFAVDLAWHGYGPETAWLVDGEQGRIGVRFCRYEKRWEAYLCNADDFDGSERYLAAVPDRGRLRRLCAALDQPLKEVK